MSAGVGVFDASSGGEGGEGRRGKGLTPFGDQEVQAPRVVILGLHRHLEARRSATIVRGTGTKQSRRIWQPAACPVSGFSLTPELRTHRVLRVPSAQDSIPRECGDASCSRGGVGEAVLENGITTCHFFTSPVVWATASRLEGDDGGTIMSRRGRSPSGKSSRSRNESFTTSSFLPKAVSWRRRSALAKSEGWEAGGCCYARCARTADARAAALEFLRLCLGEQSLNATADATHASSPLLGRQAQARRPPSHPPSVANEHGWALRKA